jgi:hypothetical protein
LEKIRKGSGKNQKNPVRRLNSVREISEKFSRKKSPRNFPGIASLFSADPELADCIFRTILTDRENNFAPGAVRLLLQIAAIAIRFINILAGFIQAGSPTQSRCLIPVPVYFLELLVAHIAEGIETGLAFLCQGIATPVQVGQGILALVFRRQKMIAGRIPRPPSQTHLYFSGGISVRTL